MFAVCAGGQAAKRRTTLTSSCASKGFERYASALQRSASRRGSATPVRMTSGTRRSAMRSSRANDGPSIPGICTSRTTTAGGSSWIITSASAPVFARGRAPLDRLAADLVRIAHPDGTIWLVVWKKDFLPEGAPSWEEAQQAMLGTGWVDNKVLSLGAEVYAARYVRRRRPVKREP